MAFHVMHAGCGGMVHRGRQGPEHCHAEPTVAGLWFAVHGRTVWLGFACDQHAADLIAARPLLPRDRDVLDRRRDKRRTSSPDDDGQARRKDPLRVVQRGSDSSSAPEHGPNATAMGDPQPARPSCPARSGLPASDERARGRDLRDHHDDHP